MIEWNIDVSQQSDRKLPMDIFVPESDRLRGALLFLHGGGFVGGRKEQFLGICASVALKTGWVCASLDYRLAGKAPFPAQTEDVRAAVAYLEAHAAQWRIDTNRVALVGGSPGGCIAAQSVLMHETCARICILLNGIVNIPAFVSRNPEEADRVRAYMPDETEWERLSPQRLTNDGAAQTHFLMIHGEKDTVVLPEEIRAFEAALRRNGAQAETVFLAGEGHAWFNAPEKQPWVIDCISDYINQTFSNQQ